MAEVVKMPKMSDTMTEGVIAKWHKKVGDQVKSGELVAEIETDKATMDFESFQAGTLLYIGPKEGEAVPIDGIIAVIGKEGEDFKSLLADSPESSASSTKKEDVAEEKDQDQTKEKEQTKENGQEQAEESDDEGKAAQADSARQSETKGNTATTSDADGRIKASPLAKKIAQEKGIDLGSVKGSAGNGRIVKKDVEGLGSSSSSAETASSQPTKGNTNQGAGVAPAAGTYEEVAVSQMRKTIAKRLSESMFTAPHFYLTMAIRMDKAVDLRKVVNEHSPVKISFNDLILKAVSLGLRKHPKVNSSWLGDKIRYNHAVNIGVAVAVEEGLLVPVIRNADTKSLSQISAEVKDYAQKAKDKKLQPSDWEGSTFTISNLGMYGLEEFTAIINTPDSCILAIGGIQEVPVVENGQVVPGNVLKVTLSCDHRVVDGAIGSEFLKTLKETLENPYSILI